MSRLSLLLAALLSLGLFVSPIVPADPARAAETPAYIAIGDSIAFGVGAANPSTMGYVGLAFEALRTSERYRDRGLTLVNLSVPGATSSDLLIPGGQLDTAIAEVERRQIAGTVADDNVEIITVHIGGNDLLSLVDEDSPCFTDAGADPCIEHFGEVLSGLQSNLEEVLQGLRKAAPDATVIVLDLYNPYSGTEDVRELIADLAVGQVNGVVAAAAAEPDLKIETASVFRHFQGRGEQWIATDSLHPNEAGHTVIAEVALAAIQARPVVIPEQLLLVPRGTVAPIAGQDPSLISSSGNDVPFILLAIAIPVTFLAGAVLSAAYFIARGRSS
jgi:lysophospholipase L1-like esterase